MRPLALLALAACNTTQTPTQTQTPAPTQTSTASQTATPTQAPTLACKTNDDCVVSNFPGCCTSCNRSAYATSRTELEKRQRICTVVDCAFTREACEPYLPAIDFRAACRAGTCVAIKR